MKFFIAVAAIVASACAVWTPTALASAETTAGSLPLATWELVDPDEPVLLTGYSDSSDFNIGLPEGWSTIGDATLEATVVTSKAARADATVRFELAGRPVLSWTNDDGADVTIPIASDLFDDGPLSVAIKATTPLASEAVCADPDHVSRWFDIGFPRVQADIVPVDIDVARAIAGIGQVSELTSEPITISLGTAISDTLLESVGAIAAAVARNGTPAAWIVTADGSPSAPGAVIRIEEQPDVEANVTVEVVDERPRVTFRGDPAGLVRLAHAVADPDRLPFFHLSTVHNFDVPEALPDYPHEVFSFSGAGYDDRTLRGFGSQGLVYRVHIPAGAPPDTATLGLSATLSPKMAAYEATISVKINGSDEEIVAIADADGSIDALHTVTPADLRPGLNFVKIETELGIQVESADTCSGSVPNWFTVSDSSALGVDRSGGPEAVQLGVEDARFALATEVDFVATDVAIPDDASIDDLRSSIALISELSSRAQGGSPRLVRDKNVDRDRHVVVTGRSGDRELLDDVPYTDRAVGIVAARPSPYATGRVYMAFTGPDVTDVSLAISSAMSSDVNNIAEPYALISIDEVRAFDDSQSASSRVEMPDGAAAGASGDRVPGPDDADYDTWLRSQLQQIEAANEPETSQRRSVALVIGLAVAMIGGLWWLRRTRSHEDVAAAH